MTRRGATAALVACAGVVAALTLGPLPGRPLSTGLAELRAVVGDAPWLDFTLWERVANVVLFVPLAVLLCAVLRRPLLALAVCVAGSVGIETVQALAGAGRTPSLVDVAANSLGAAVGCTAHLLRRRAGAAPGDGGRDAAHDRAAP